MQVACLVRASLGLAVTLLATPRLHADVLVVGDVAHFGTLSEAIQAADDGDTILIRYGNYTEDNPIVIDGKALSIVGETPHDELAVVIRQGLVVKNLLPGQSVILQNLIVRVWAGVPMPVPVPALSLIANQSHVRVQDCTLEGDYGTSDATPDGAPAVSVSDSLSAAIVGSTLRGGLGKYTSPTSIISGNGGPGIALDGGSLLVSASVMFGGQGGGAHFGSHGGHGGAGIAHEQGTLSIVGGYVDGGAGGDDSAPIGGDGGDALVVGSSGSVQLMGGVFTLGGFGALGQSVDGVDGVDIFDPFGLVTDYGGTPHGFDVFSPVREGQQGTLHLQGEASDATLLFASLDLHQLPLPAHQGVLMLDPAGMFGPIPLPPPGNVDIHFTAPMLPPALDALDVHVQPAYVGGDGVILGTGRVLTLLDASF